MFWVIVGVMLLVAVLVVVYPQYRAQNKITAMIVVAAVVVTGLSAGLYSNIGTPNVSVAETAAPDVDAMMTSLATRLKENPNDLAGWKMLGRSYFTTRNFPGAIAAFEKAVALESGKDSQTLSDLGEAVLYEDQTALMGRAGELFESALAIQPNNPKALFYGGMAAVERGNKELGATRWEALLATSPPPNVQEVLRNQIAALRGENVPPPISTPAPVEAATVITVDVALGDAALAAQLPEATVFIIARDPAQPSPPIAAVRRQLSELPTSIPIGDSDAMIPGRVPSKFAKLEIVARVSLGGQPIAASGDWFGQEIVDTAASDTITITINQEVP